MAPRKTVALFINNGKEDLIEIPDYYNQLFDFLRENHNDIDEIDINEESVYKITTYLFFTGITKIYCKEKKLKFLFTHLDLIKTDNKNADFAFKVTNMLKHI